MRESPNSLETEPILSQPEEISKSTSNNQYRDVSVDEKMADCEAAPQAPLDPATKYEKSLKKAQEEWVQRRKAGFEDYGAEMAKDAKIWQIYVRETDKADEELVDGWNKFVGISAKNLQQDPSETSAQALLLISQILLATSGDGTTDASSAGLEQVSTDFRPSATTVAINALWFLSLSLSVAVSLIAMLAKEWCNSFMSGRSGETYERGRLRQQRWNEIERLRMIDALTLLPLLIHLALLLFAVGLCIYLWGLNIAVAIPVITITFISTLIYVSTIFHSLTAEHCPYTTASSKLAKSYIKAWLNSPASLLGAWIEASYARLRSSVTTVISLVNSLILKVGVNLHPRTRRYGTRLEPQSRILRLVTFVLSYVKTLRTSWVTHSPQKRDGNDSVDVEDYLAHDAGMDITTSQMLGWLLVNRQDSGMAESLVYSLAGAEPWLPRLPLLEGNALSVVFRYLDKYFNQNIYEEPYHMRPGVSPEMAALCLRALQFLLGYYNGHGFVLCTGPKVVMKNTWSCDFYVRHLGEIASGIEREALDFRIESSPTSSSDITAFCDNFCLTVASEADPNPRYLYLYQEGAINMVEAHINCDIVLHPATLIAIVRQMTNRLCLPTYLWKDRPDAPFRLCFLLLRLYLHSELHDRHLDLRHAISVAVTAAVLNFGAFPGWSHPPGHATSSRAVEFVAYHNPPRSITFEGKELSLSTSRKFTMERLIEFGLLGLLELPQAQRLTPEDLDTWLTAFDQLLTGYFVDHVYIHSIPRSFTFGVHTARLVAQYFNNDRPSNDFVTTDTNWLRCFSAICDWTLESEDHLYDHGAVHSALLNSLCTVVSPEQQRCCAVLLKESPAGCKKSCLESLPSDILTRLLAVSLSGSTLVTLTAMRELWFLTASMLRLSDDSPAIGCQLLSLVPSTATAVPKFFGELGLLQQWFPQLQKMCIESPQELLDSGFISSIRNYYSTDHCEDVVVRPFSGRNGPESIQGSRVAEILGELEENCNSTVANRKLWHELPFDEPTEEADNQNNQLFSVTKLIIEICVFL
ncbi:hypothetical protein FRC12_015676 [Ceratobasidium sp. 428]|nr:hypothetical protein FRC12_015676 [Ceratobasidium sp. 428]